MVKFRDTNLEKKFNRDGYVVINLLNTDEFNLLKEVYDFSKDLHLQKDKKIHSTCDTNNLNFILEIDKKISEIISKPLGRIIESPVSLLNFFLIKKTGGNSETGFHQDPTLVENEDLVSANVWIPLTSVNSTNGNLKLIPGSHRLIKKIIVDQSNPVFFENIKEVLPAFQQEIPICAGQAVVLHHRLIHGAYDNFSHQDRTVGISIIKSTNSRWVKFFHFDNNKIGKIIIDKIKYIEVCNGVKPSILEIDELIDYNRSKISKVYFHLFYILNYPKLYIKTNKN